MRVGTGPVLGSDWNVAAGAVGGNWDFSPCGENASKPTSLTQLGDVSAGEAQTGQRRRHPGQEPGGSQHHEEVGARYGPTVPQKGVKLQPQELRIQTCL